MVAGSAESAAALMTKMKRDVTRNIFAGSIAISIAVGTFNPLDTLRIRWQVTSAASTGAADLHGSSCMNFGRKIVTQEGLLKGLWTPGLGANMTSFFICGGFRQGFYPYLRDGIGLATGTGGKTPFTMAAGGFAAGGVAFFACTPFFQLKTLMQAEAGVIDKSGGSKPDSWRLTTGTRTGSSPEFHGRFWWLGFGRILRERGVAGLWRGATVLVARGSLLASGQMLGYDGMKTYFQRCPTLADGTLGPPPMTDGPALHCMASVMASLLSCTFSAPADIIMTRYQAAAAGLLPSTRGFPYDGVLDCIRRMAREEGAVVFFRGWVPFVVRVTPLFIINLPLYEQIRSLFGIGYLD